MEFPPAQDILRNENGHLHVHFCSRRITLTSTKVSLALTSVKHAHIKNTKTCKNTNTFPGIALGHSPLFYERHSLLQGVISEF